MNPYIDSRGRGRLDITAVALSGVCVLHCLALPVSLTMVPVLSVGFLDEAVFHAAMITIILPVSLIALTIGCLRHRDSLTLLLGGAGLTLLTLTAFFGHDWFGPVGERLAISAAGLTLASAHVRNYRRCRRVDCNHDR